MFMKLDDFLSFCCNLLIRVAHPLLVKNKYIELRRIQGDNSGNEVTMHQEALRATV